MVAGKVNANIPRLTASRLEEVFQEFYRRGLAFIWEQFGKRYLHWTGSQRKGRWPRESRRNKKYEKELAPRIKQYPEIVSIYRSYLQRFNETPEASEPDAFASASASASALASGSASAVEEQDYNFSGKHLKITTDQNRKLSETYPSIDLQKEYAEMDIWIDTQEEEKRWQNQYAGARNWCKRTVDRQEKDRSESAVGRGPQPESKPGKCGCGAEIPAGFLKCLKCMKKKAPANP